MPISGALFHAYAIISRLSGFFEVGRFLGMPFAGFCVHPFACDDLQTVASVNAEREDSVSAISSACGCVFH